MYLDAFDFKTDTKVLHFAPERSLYEALKNRVTSGNYVTADLDPTRYKFAKNIVKIDCCDMDEQPSNEYDLIIHSHIFEHLPCDFAYTLSHMHRMLKPNGKQICVIPFMSGMYDECFQDISEKEREERFGQHDHVRRFGADDIDRHLGSIVNLPAQFDAVKIFGENRLKRVNIPKTAWRGFTFNTVLVLDKKDIKIT
jgi:phosphoglycolate phosphatase